MKNNKAKLQTITCKKDKRTKKIGLCETMLITIKAQNFDPKSNKKPRLESSQFL